MENIIEFSGYNWMVRQSREMVGPGPNYFSAKAVKLISNELRLEVIQDNGTAYCSEIILDKPLGYGKYIFQLSSRIDLLEDDLVLGLFTWDEDYSPYNCEIDIEFSRWGKKNNMNSQFVVQPGDDPKNIFRFETILNGDYSTHIIEWLPEVVRFYSIHGHPNPIMDKANLIKSWNYSGKHIPNPANERIHINLWKISANRTLKIEGRISYVDIKKFTFEPL